MHNRKKKNSPWKIYRQTTQSDADKAAIFFVKGNICLWTSWDLAKFKCFASNLQHLPNSKTRLSNYIKIDPATSNLFSLGAGYNQTYSDHMNHFYIHTDGTV